MQYFSEFNEEYLISVLNFFSNEIWIWGAIQCFLIFFGFYFVTSQLKVARIQNSISALNYFKQNWNSRALLRARLAVVKQSNQEKTDFAAHEDVIASFMEDLGAAMKLGQIDKSHVWSYFSFYIEAYWLILNKKVFFYREEILDKSYFGNFELLYNSTLNYSVKKKPLQCLTIILGLFEKKSMNLLTFYWISVIDRSPDRRGFKFTADNVAMLLKAQAKH